MSKFTESELDNILDALQEWHDVVGAKELKANEVGLDSERYANLVSKLEKEINYQRIKKGFSKKDFTESFKVTLAIDFDDLYKFAPHHSDNWKNEEKPTKRELTESIISEIISWLNDLKFDVAVEWEKE